MTITDDRDAVPLLVGRERELGLLRDHLAAAIGGRGTLVLIGGEAGIGKTALAESACREARDQHALVLVGRCFDLTETPPYGPWVELFRHYPATVDLPPLPAAFAQRGTVGAVTSQAGLFQQVEDFFRDCATQRPIALLLDDLHWADPASLDLLRFLAQSAQSLPLLLLGTYRVDELTRRHPLYALLPTLVREAHAARVDLRPLTEDALRALIGARYWLRPANAARLLAWLQERAEGNPFFLGELLRTLEEEGTLHPTDDGWVVGDLREVRIPPLLRQVIDGRLARSGEDVQRLLAVAAVLGQEVPLAVWEAVAAIDEETLLAAVDRAVEAHLLVEMPDGLQVRFVHALTREAVYEGISPARRRRLHRQIAELLAAQPQPDPDAVAMHFQHAGDPDAVEWLVRAGERAQLASAWMTAIDRYEAALTLLEASEDDVVQQGWLHYRIARLLRHGMPAQSLEHVDVALHVAVFVRDPALAAASRYTRGLALSYAGQYEAGRHEIALGCDALEALPFHEQARLDLGPDEHGLPTITNPRGMLVEALAYTGPIAEAIAVGERTREGIPRYTPLGELGWAHYGDRLQGLGGAYAFAGRPSEAREAFERARTCFREIGNYDAVHGAFTFDLLHVSLPFLTDTPRDREQLAEEAVAARRRSFMSAEFYERLAHLPVLALAGQWDEARAGAEAALRHTRWQRAYRDIAAVVLVDLLYAQGTPDEAWAHIHDYLPSPQVTPGSWMWHIGLPLLRRAAVLSLDAGDLDAARQWLEAHDRWLASSGAVLGQSEGHACWAHYFWQSGETERAFEHAHHALDHASEPRQPLALIAAHRLLGELNSDAGQFVDAETHLRASLTLADACAAPYERALTLLAFAALRAATGATAVARTLLDEVRTICTPLDAKPTLARAEALATRLAATAGVFPDGLSNREVDVLRLIAAGHNNQEIADALSLSIRTVERHITNLYGKIRAHGRADATAYALRHLP
jgi:DNA-binding CsgD family transcriptional regulator